MSLTRPIDSPLHIRDDLAAAQAKMLACLSEPGTWWTGAERRAIALEARAARDCTLCSERKAALSPFSVDGTHDGPADLDVEGCWVLALRDLPGSIEGEVRQELRRFSSLRYKSMLARDRGARGVLFASGPAGQFRHELVPLRFDASLAGTSIALVSITA